MPTRPTRPTRPTAWIYLFCGIRNSIRMAFSSSSAPIASSSGSATQRSWSVGATCILIQRIWQPEGHLLPRQNEFRQRLVRTLGGARSAEFPHWQVHFSIALFRPLKFYSGHFWVHSLNMSCKRWDSPRQTAAVTVEQQNSKPVWRPSYIVHIPLSYMFGLKQE